MSDPGPVVRFAPSPTGHLHIGGVRTALFNYFYAKNLGGHYILRIEDTDVSRSSKSMSEEIINGLHWLGIHWDSGPFYQSDRFDKYKETAYKLLEQKKAYRCFCPPDERDEQLFKYDRKCLSLTDAEIDKKLELHTPFVIRFFIPPGSTYFKDRVHKEMKIDNDELDDFVILKSDHSPTYHLSVVVDDSAMKITDVIRGDDHISNTFKQVLLFRAIGAELPKFAHLPLILGPDKKKLSKRHGETSVLEFKNKGYLPEAIINYLSQLSWIPADSKNLLTMEELIKQFSLGKLSKSSPVFDYDKLRFINSRAIQEKKAGDILLLLEENQDFHRNYSEFETRKKEALIDLVKPRMKTLDDFDRKFEFYLKGKLNYENSDLEKLNELSGADDLIRYLNIMIPRFQEMETTGFDRVSMEKELRELAGSNGLKAADLIHPARFALTSEIVSPSIFEVFEFFGKEESIKRLTAFLHFLEKKKK